MSNLALKATNPQDTKEIVRAIFSRSEAIFDSFDVTDNTKTDYKYRIQQFKDFVRDHGFNRNSYREYKTYLKERNDLSTSSKNKYLITAKIYLKELHQQGLPTDITQNTKGFRNDKKHKRDGLNQKEVDTLVEKLRTLPHTPENTRTIAIFALLALQGLRQIEVTRLDVTDIDLSGKRAHILGKGRDDKEAIDLHPECVAMLKNYIKANKIKDGALFTSHSNNSKNARLTTRGVRAIVRETLQELNIEKTTHGFRHYFTTTLVKSFKGDLLKVSQFTRHKSLEMLQVYFDEVKKREDLPKYYHAFSSLSFQA